MYGSHTWKTELKSLLVVVGVVFLCVKVRKHIHAVQKPQKCACLCLSNAGMIRMFHHIWCFVVVVAAAASVYVFVFLRILGMQLWFLVLACRAGTFLTLSSWTVQIAVIPVG